MATLQKLLWTEEYSDFSDEVVLVESRFVLERKHGECLCMVHAGLTHTVVLIAEESVEADADHLRTVAVATDAPSNLEYLYLAHLFPLQNTRLSTRRHQEHRGEHVLRLRLSSGKTWYLELAEGRHREDRWREWLSWIHDLDKRRLEMHHQMTLHPRSREAIRAQLNWGNLEEWTADGQEGAAALAAAQQRTRRDSRAYHWVGHFGGALSRDHDGQITGEDYDAPDAGLPGLLLGRSDSIHHSPSSNMRQHGRSHVSKSATVVDPSASFVWQQPGDHHSLPVRKITYSSTDTYSSLEDIESVGSLVGDASFDWNHPVSDNINQKLILCVGDLFQKFNIEAHGHGHVGRWRPMASLTAVDQLRESDVTTSHGERRGLPPLPAKEMLHRRYSLPDVLEGEASFLDDMQPAADVAHRKSLVYLDLMNDDDTKTPHVFGGHVMLLSPEQTRLQQEITKSRELPADLEFVTAEGKGRRGMSGQGGAPISGRVGVTALARQTVQRHGRKTEKSMKERLHLGSHDSHREPLRKQHAKLKSDTTEHLSARILRNIRKRKRSRRDGRPDQITSVHDIDPAVLAGELTSLDSLLFVRVREAELVDCLWLKGDRHARAPHTTRLIEFFERVVGLVSTEILRGSTARERAATVARFVLVAERCRKLQNFHSLKAVLSGLKVPPIYRLRRTWQAFEEDHPAEFGAWSEMVFLMADDGKSDLYKMAVKKSLLSPPCLPFIGPFLLSVVDLYSAVDRAGMQQRRFRRYDQFSSSSSSPSCYSSTDERESTIQDVCYVTDDSNTANSTTEYRTQPKSAHHVGFFDTFASAWHKLHLKHGKLSGSQAGAYSVSSCSPESEATGARRMTQGRKERIRALIIDYAKRCAQQRGMEWRAGGGRGAVTAQDLLEAALFAGVGNPINWGSLFSKVQPADCEMLAVSKQETEEKEAKKNAEYQLYRTLFTHQMAAVQYTHGSNRAARNYLLHAEYNTDQQNFKLSMSREPPSD
ncbi:uncharacterized protein LOC110977032 [Acanthaster planci]|uniref:Uncharacterized protein LOC110977032 n=1 Tax=Acanthaster planci TaxID=133434 RepID=A0A8B7Y001_ACAPL|nr:uncharacterized protein LOC110977032 [Acanthaster planci]